MATFSESLRRLYSDIIWRRSRVRITPAVEPALACDPVFVIGMYRSGTTLLRYILDSHSNLACPPESAFFSQLDAMYRDGRSKVGFESLGFSEDHVLARMRQFAAYFFESYAASHGKSRWVDKSPSYVDHLEFIEKLFPNGRMLMIFRHPLDQVQSAAQRNTIRPGELASYCRDDEEEGNQLVYSRYWADKARTIHNFCERSPYPCRIIRYEEMCERPEEILKPVFEFLGEPWEENVLRFYESDHDRGYEDGRAAATRGFDVSSGKYKSWPEDLRKSCWNIVEPIATCYGYSL